MIFAFTNSDNREWDAVISVRRNTSEEDFVLGTLCPKLEKEMGFRVNIHNCGSKPGDGKYRFKFRLYLFCND